MKVGYINKIFYILGDNSKKVYSLVVLFLLSSVLDLVGIGLIAPYIALIIDPSSFQGNELFYSMISTFGLDKEQDQLVAVFGKALIIVFFLKFLSAVYINYKIMDFCYQEGVNVRSKLMEKYQNLPYETFIKVNSSEYIYTIQTNALLFSQSILQAFMRLASDGAITIAIILFLFWQSPYPLTLLVLLLAVPIISYDLIFRKNIARYGKETNKNSARMLQSTQEGLSGLKEIRVLGKERYFYDSVVSSSRGYANAATKSSVIKNIPRVLLELVLVVFIVLLVYFSMFFSGESGDLLPILGTFGVAAVRLAPSASQIVSSVSNIRFGEHTVDTIYNHLRISSDIKKKSINNGVIDEEFKSLRISNASFFYETDNIPTLNNISFEITKGEAVGIIGPSGSGKTTLVDVILGLLELRKGDILYNGKDVAEILGDWSGKVAYIPQDIFLIDDSIRKNVALGVNDDNIDNDKVIESIQKSMLSDLLSTLPEGVDTILGENGVRLSGGQRQRIALARAFYHEREVLVMDEATSALDSGTETEIINEIQSLKGNMTMIIIAHRLSTVQHCDRVYFLDKGDIAKVGTLDDKLNFTEE